MTGPGPRASAAKGRGSETPAGAGHAPAPAAPQAEALNLQRTAGNAATARLLGPGDGRPLDPATRRFMEARFGHDFSPVRVHTDARAAESAKAVNALAYCVGPDVVFNAGRYAPETESGRHLLAHELAHVVQQGRGGATSPTHSPPEPLERAAGRAADALKHDAGPGRVEGASPHDLARQPDPAKKDADLGPLRIPSEGIEMPWVGKGKGVSSTELGYLRDSNRFWNEYKQKWPDQLSPENKERAGTSRPVVDDTWIKFHPEHAPYKGQPLEHHHLGQGSRAVPLPEKLHDAYTVFHPKRQVVAEGSGKPNPITPGRTREQDQKEIDRHTRDKRIAGEGIDPAHPPQAPDIPRSSALAGVPKDELKPVKPDTGVDPKTGVAVPQPKSPAAQDANAGTAVTPPATPADAIVKAQDATPAKPAPGGGEPSTPPTGGAATGPKKTSGPTMRAVVTAKPSDPSGVAKPTAPPPITAKPPAPDAPTKAPVAPRPVTPRIEPSRAPGSAGGGGTVAGLGDPVKAIEDPGFSARSAAIEGGTVLALEAINSALNSISDEYQRKAMEADYQKNLPLIRETLRKSPGVGIVMEFHFTRVIPHPDSIIRPGDKYEYLIWHTADRPGENYGKGWDILPPGMTSSVQRKWVPPVKSKDEAKALETPTAVVPEVNTFEQWVAQAGPVHAKSRLRLLKALRQAKQTSGAGIFSGFEVVAEGIHVIVRSDLHSQLVGAYEGVVREETVKRNAALKARIDNYQGQIQSLGQEGFLARTFKGRGERLTGHELDDARFALSKAEDELRAGNFEEALNWYRKGDDHLTVVWRKLYTYEHDEPPPTD